MADDPTAALEFRSSCCAAAVAEAEVAISIAEEEVADISAVAPRPPRGARALEGVARAPPGRFHCGGGAMHGTIRT